MEQPPKPPNWEPPAGSGSPPPESGNPPEWLYTPDDAARSPASQGGQARPGQTPGNATASLVLGIVGLVLCPIVCSVLAIVFGNQAREQIKRDPSLGGEGVANAGYILGIVGIVLYGAIILFWIVAIALAS